LLQWTTSLLFVRWESVILQLRLELTVAVPQHSPDDHDQKSGVESTQSVSSFGEDSRVLTFDFSTMGYIWVCYKQMRSVVFGYISTQINLYDMDIPDHLTELCLGYFGEIMEADKSPMQRSQSGYHFNQPSKQFLMIESRVKQSDILHEDSETVDHPMHPVIALIQSSTSNVEGSEGAELNMEGETPDSDAITPWSSRRRFNSWFHSF